MKRKFTFFGICVLVCTLMISLGSCQKDYSEDIDDLQEQINDIKGDIAALNQAIAQGKIITSVSNVTGGYEITFSDNSSIVIEHGQDGADGADGADGEDGATGADGFTPIIGVDADGYWTVVTTEGGTPVRIQDVNGNDVKAELDDEFGVTANGMLTIGGVETAVQIPVIVYNEETETLQITIKNEEGDFVTYNIPIAENAFGVADLTSVVSPIGSTNVLIGYGMVPLTGVPADGLEWAGVEAGDQLRSGGILPVILNPSEVAFEDYDYTVINSQGNEYDLQPDSVSAGYDGSFTQFIVLAEGNNGLFSLHFNPTQDELEDLDGTVTEELAVKVSKDGRDVISGYQYAIKVAQDSPLAYVLNTNPGEEIWNGSAHVIYSVIGEEIDVLPRYLTPNLTGRELVQNDFYKAGVLADTNDVNDALQAHVTIDGTTLSTEATAAVNTALNDSTLKYFFRTMDWAGGYVQNDVEVVYWARLDDEVEAYDSFTHVLDDVVRTDTVSFDAVGDVIMAAGKDEAMVNNATNFKIEIEDADGNPVGTADGIDYEFIDEDGDPLVGSSMETVNQLLASVMDLDRVVFHFDETVALPGDYVAIVSFDDARLTADSDPLTYPTYDEFTVEMPFTIENPDIDLDLIAEHRSNVFFGNDTLIVYGYSPIDNVAQRDPATTYPLYNAYKHLEDSVAVWSWGFESDDVTLTDGIAEGDIFSVTDETMYEEYAVTLYYYVFGNINNKLVVEDIIVSSQSEVKDGELILNNNLPELIYGNTSSSNAVNLSTYYKAVDYLNNDLNVFDSLTTAATPVAGIRDVRADVVTLVVDSDYAHLVELEQTATDWVVRAKVNVNVLPTDYVDVPLTLTITDLYDVETVYEITVRVVKP